MRRRVRLLCSFVGALGLAAAAAGPAEPGLQRAAIAAIERYQHCLSPHLPLIRCRYEESCSHYSKRCIQEHGFFRGTYMGLCRLASCR
jgi:putative component of membrane protein insertase Oxa1/YidC/SpoIIIJ protein YidD